MRLTAALLLTCAACAVQAPAFRAGAAPLAAHAATYALTLKPSSDQDVIAASGTMTYEVLDACTAWTTAQHLVINLTNKDGQDVKMVSDYATLEAKDGRHLEFHTKQVTDGAVTESLDGSATLDASGRGTADFTSPERNRVKLPPGTLLPMAHTGALIDGAAAGKKFLSLPLFDGTDADGAQDTFVTIESWDMPSAGAPHDPAWPALAAQPSGRMHIAFFDRAKSAETPTYEIGMRYFQDGVADGLTMNFGDFAMQGELAQFALRQAPRC
jgi:hypothetical protein